MFRILFGFLLVCIVLSRGHAVNQCDWGSIFPHRASKDSREEQAKMETEARRLWEQAILAKGGRERLRGIRNIVISSRGEYIMHGRKTNTVVSETLFVFPGKVWSWQDYGKDGFGSRMEMHNYEANTKYIVTPNEPNSHWRPSPQTKKLSHE
jgi:hypothetical protein